MNYIRRILYITILGIFVFCGIEKVQALGDTFTVNNSVTTTITARNKIRNANELIVYDSSFGASTMNNQWGYEIVVENNIVTKIFIQGQVETIAGKGANIPTNGFVISAHGTAIDNQLKAILVGDTVILDQDIEVTYDKAFRVNGGAQVAVNKVNSTRSADTLVLFSYAYGEKTGTNPWGYEVIVDKDNIVIDIRTKGSGNDSGSIIPPYGYVLSAHGAREADLVNIAIGDVITLEGITIIDLDKSVTYKYAALNPNAINNPAGVDATGTPYLGFRGANQLVIYDIDYPSATTNTNDYGYEIIVTGPLDNGVITSIGGNNTAITENTYILSGHGDAASFLINNAKIGANVIVNQVTNEVTIKITPSSLVDSHKIQFDNAQTLYNQAVNNLITVDSEAAALAISNATKAQSIANNLLDKVISGDTSAKYQFLDALEQVRIASLELEYASVYSRVIEGRAVWHRPKEQSIADVQDTLQQLKDTNFNVIYLETFFNGHVIFPIDSTVTSQNPLFANQDYGIYGNDLLKAFVEEAKKYDIEVHSWVHDFYVGYQGYGSVILDAKPEWELLNYNGKRETTLEGGIYYFMDPSNPEVQQFLLDMYKDIVINYEIAGLQLDYIRYPVGEKNNDWGYNQSSIDRFIKANGLEQDLDIKTYLAASTTNYDTWYKWKQDNITNFVKNVSDTLRGIDQDIILSTAIFANIDEAKLKKMQDWPLWVENGYLDVTAPMAYYKDTKTVMSSVAKMVEYVNGNTFNFAGIAPTYLGLTAEYNFYQILASREGQAQGYSIFASQNVLNKNDVQAVLKKSVNRKKAITPNRHSKELLGYQLEYIKSNYDTVYTKSGNASKIQQDAFINDYTKYIQIDEIALSYLKVNIDNLKIVLSNVANYGDVKVQERLVEDLTYLLNILETKYKKENLLNTTFEYNLNSYYYQDKTHKLAIDISNDTSVPFTNSATNPLILNFKTTNLELDFDSMLALNSNLQIVHDVLVVSGDSLILVFKTSAPSATIQLNNEIINLDSIVFTTVEVEKLIAKAKTVTSDLYTKTNWIKIQTIINDLDILIEQSSTVSGDDLYAIENSINMLSVELKILLDDVIVDKRDKNEEIKEKEVLPKTANVNTSIIMSIILILGGTLALVINCRKKIKI